MILLFAALFLETPLLHADFSYYYAGAPFTNFIGQPFVDHIDAVVVLAGPLGPNALVEDIGGTPDPGAIAPLYWDMSGKTPFSISRMYLRTDALGHISDWHLDTSFVEVGGDYSGCQTSGPGQFDECVSVPHGNLAEYENGPNGIWTSDAVTPEPYLLLPLGLGFVALCLTRSRS